MGIQDFGAGFQVNRLHHARAVAQQMTQKLAESICPGMVEADAHQLYKDLCREYPVEKQWHPPKLRFGPNTIKNFREPSDPYMLTSEDLFFIDIGPVIDGHEADYGETFVIGDCQEYLSIKEASQEIFSEVSAYWQKTQTTGIPLYEFAKKCSMERGYILNMGSDGHRIGDFPHHVHFKGSLLDCEEKIVPNAWILEIHLWNQDNMYGAFFEDLLTIEES